MIEDRLRQSAPAGDVAAAVARATARAEAEGLLDVAYAQADSPLGPLVLAATPQGLVRLAYEDFNGGLDAVLEHLTLRVSPRILEAPARLDGVMRELDEFFAGRREGFDVALDWSLTSGFTQRVLEATAAIPFGSVSTYQAVAEGAGSPKATRAAGNALGSNPIPIVVPCHRVLRTGGGQVVGRGRRRPGAQRVLDHAAIHSWRSLARPSATERRAASSDDPMAAPISRCERSPTKRSRTALRCLGGSACTALHRSWSGGSPTPRSGGAGPASSSGTGTGRRARARWWSSTLLCAIVSSQPLRLSVWRSLGYARSALSTVSWKQSSASTGPTDAAQKRRTLTACSSSRR